MSRKITGNHRINAIGSWKYPCGTVYDPNAPKRTSGTEAIPCYCKCERIVRTEERRIKILNLIMKYRERRES